MTDDGGLSDAGDAGPPPCTGCLELRTTVTDVFEAENAFFQIGFAAADLTGVTVTFRLRGLTLDEDVVASPFATDGETDGFVLGAEFTLLNSDNGFDTEGEFVDLEFDITAIDAAGFDDEDVIALGLQVGYVGDVDTEDGTTVTVLLDSITFDGDGPLDDFTFDDSAEGLAVPGFGAPGEVIVHPE